MITGRRNQLKTWRPLFFSILLEHNQELSDQTYINLAPIMCWRKYTACTFIYFCNVDKQVLQLILISFVGTDVSKRNSLMWVEATVYLEKTQVSKQGTILHFHIQPLSNEGLNCGHSGENLSSLLSFQLI